MAHSSGSTDPLHDEIYLDHAASTPLHPDVLAAMDAVQRNAFGNPSSVHAAGRRSRRLIEEARDRVAASINASPREIVFTSGATEADNLAVRGIVGAVPGRLVTSPLEHSAVLSAARAVARTGREVVYVEPDERGVIGPAELEAVLVPGTALVALMLVNNETGIRTAIPELAAVAHAAGALVFCDAVQAYGFESLDVATLGVDALALSAHKAYGPKGAGALWVRDGVPLEPVTFGGEQERGLRPGTHDTGAIVGLGEAAALAAANATEHGRAVAALRDRFEALIEGAEGVTVVGKDVPRGPKHSSIHVEGVDGEALLMGLDAARVYVSAGSACSAGSIEPSHVLTAMGFSPAAAKATIRFTFGSAVEERQVEEAARRFLRVMERCRAILA